MRRVFNELEKELRALTDNRIALEIKLDYLNTATATQSTNQNQKLTPASNLNANLPNSNTTTSNSTNNCHINNNKTIPSTPVVAGNTVQNTNPSSWLHTHLESRPSGS